MAYRGTKQSQGLTVSGLGSISGYFYVRSTPWLVRHAPDGSSTNSTRISSWIQNSTISDNAIRIHLAGPSFNL